MEARTNPAVVEKRIAELQRQRAIEQNIRQMKERRLRERNLDRGWER